MAETPSFGKLRAERQGGEHYCSSFAQGMHDNKYFFKYYWWVFWNDSPADGEEFLTDQYRLSTAAAIELMDRLKREKEPYWVYNVKLPRHDPVNTPFDIQSPHWHGQEWAPAYDQDHDPIALWKGLGLK